MFGGFILSIRQHSTVFTTVLSLHNFFTTTEQIKRVDKKQTHTYTGKMQTRDGNGVGRGTGKWDK